MSDITNVLATINTSVSLFGDNPLSVALDNKTEVEKESLNSYFDSFQDSTEWFDGLLKLDIYDQIKIIKYMKQNDLFPSDNYLNDWIIGSGIIHMERELVKSSKNT